MQADPQLGYELPHAAFPQTCDRHGAARFAASRLKPKTMRTAVSLTFLTVYRTGGSRPAECQDRCHAGYNHVRLTTAQDVAAAFDGFGSLCNIA